MQPHISNELSERVAYLFSGAEITPEDLQNAGTQISNELSDIVSKLLLDTLQIFEEQPGLFSDTNNPHPGHDLTVTAATNSESLAIWGNLIENLHQYTDSIITMEDVIESIVAPEKALRNTYRLLKENGFLCAFTSNHESSFSKMRKFFDPM